MLLPSVIFARRHTSAARLGQLESRSGLLGSARKLVMLAKRDKGRSPAIKHVVFPCMQRRWLPARAAVQVGPRPQRRMPLATK